MNSTEFEAKMKRRPHVVILGAGASVAAIPHGDANGKKISAMAGFIDTLGMSDLIASCNLNTTSDNLEDIYMELYERDNEDTSFHDVRIELEHMIEEYFISYQIPEDPTVYDFLTLSLTKKDLIASFNWDPLLMQAYRRCAYYTRNLPQMVFLHGNVAVGVCEKDKVAGVVGRKCNDCGDVFKPMPLLYPIKKKDYTSNWYIAQSWSGLQYYMNRAYRLTIFGYSAPKSDVAAVGMLKSAWGAIEDRGFEEIEIIDIVNEDKVRDSWKDFIHTHHYSVHKKLFESALGTYPRRTCDVLFDNTMNVRWSYGNRGFKEGMNFDDIEKLIKPMLEDEMGKGENDILNDPYV